MSTHNPENERTKRRYFTYLKEARRQNQQTIDAVAKSLHRFEEYTKFRDFKAFHHQQAIAFKTHLTNQRNQQSGDKLSKATLHSTLASLRRFFQWLYGQPGYRSGFLFSDADYFNLSEKDVRIATSRPEREAPTLEQIRHVLASMPVATEIDRRNRAIIAFTLLVGARDRAIASLKLKHVDLDAACVYQDAKEVHTKFSKTITSCFFPVGEDIRRIVTEWVTYLREVKLWGLADPLFPATRVHVGNGRRFEVAGLDRRHWQNAGPIRKIFREAFQRAGLPYFNPHSFRKTLVLMGEKICNSPEEFKAWSQNLGHEGVLTTFRSYGEIPIRRQREVILALGKPRPGRDVDLAELVQEAVRAAKAAESSGGNTE